jgi:hypothetical protein
MKPQSKIKFYVGDNHYILKGPGKPYKIHILSLLKSDGNNLVIYKWYGRHKQWWHYEIKEDYLLEIEIEGCKKYNKTLNPTQAQGPLL